MKHLLGFLFVLLITALPGVKVSSAQTPDALLQEIRAAFQQLDYERAEQQAAEALAQYDRLSNDQLVEIHTTLGLIRYTRNELEASRKQFESALALAPDLELDPFLVSPKILEFFEQIRSEWESEPLPELAISAPDVRYVQLVDTRASATLRSMILPGWGQLYKKQPVKGWAMAGAWSMAGTGIIVSAVEQHRISDRLNDPDEQGDMDELQGRRDAWRRRQRTFVMGAAGVWLYSYLDALLVNRPRSRYSVPQGFYLSPDRDAVAFGYRLSF